MAVVGMRLFIVLIPFAQTSVTVDTERREFGQSQAQGVGKILVHAQNVGSLHAGRHDFMGQHSVAGRHHGRSKLPPLIAERIFGRHAGACHHIARVGVFHHVIQQELGIAFQQRIGRAAQVILIQRVLILRP